MLKLLLLAAALLLTPTVLHAQANHESSLSEAEVEALRDSAYIANDRVTIFIKFLDVRSSSIQTLATKPRRPGREEDLHDLYEQFTSIADELDDNLDDLGPRHRDIRKALPKLVAATERWATALKTPAENEAYNVSRKLALEAVRDLRESATKLIDEQKAWFIAHPPPKDEPANSNETKPH
jgi:Rad3-related DNA helicase